MLDFKILSGKLTNPMNLSQPDEAKIELKRRFNMGVDLTQKIIKADLIIHLSSMPKEEDLSGIEASYHFSFFYRVDNLGELVTLKDENGSEELFVDSHLSNAIASITYSTSRGVLMARLQGTVLSNFFLPVVNPNDLLQKNISE